MAISNFRFRNLLRRRLLVTRTSDSPQGSPARRQSVRARQPSTRPALRRPVRVPARMRSLAVTLPAALCVVLSLAAAPVFWRVSTQAEFLRGEVDALTIDADGHLGLGPGTDEFFTTTAPVLWSLTTATDGALWAGSGNDGRLYRVESDGGREVVFDADASDIFALAPAPDGAVFAATSPRGQIYRVTPDGSATTVFDPDDTYIWALLPESDGALLAATGDPARIYRIDPAANEAEVLFESDATHVLSLALEPGGAVLAGTESPGQVVRIDRTGRAFVLLDSPHDEVRSLRMHPDGGVIVTAVSGQGGTASSAAAPATPARTQSTGTPSVSVTTSVTAVVVADSTATAAPAASTNGPASGGGRGAIYRIAANGLWDELWSSDADTPYDAVIDVNGELLVGTGTDGKLYRVSNEPPRTVLLGRAPARQITQFLRQPDGSFLYSTANPGKVVRLTGALAERGTYESEVRDAGTAAAWGTISWRGATPGGSRIELSTRSGNTEMPNDTWSAWSPPSTAADGTRITSPNARYLQWRVTLFAGDAPPRLTSVTAAYLPRNLRPEVTQVTVHPPGTVFQQPFGTGDPPLAGLEEEPRADSAAATLGREGYRKGVQTFVWQASDANDDRLEYAVWYQREGEDGWRVLREGLRATVFAWDTSLTPDGAYRIKVTATDARANSPETVLVGERESGVFDIDNSAPAIELGELREEDGRNRLDFAVRDTHSPIRRVEIREDAQPWRLLYPTDGIPDGRVEQFVVWLQGDGGRVVIRATDALDNTVTVSGRPE